MDKICFKCGSNKALTEYYKHKGMTDGYLGKCKDCTKNDSKDREEELKNNPAWYEKEKERHRDKYYRLGYKEKHKPTKENKAKAMKKYGNKYPEKMKAKSMSASLKAKIKGNHLHHWSYNKEHFKDVIELSVKDHYLVHRLTIYDEERRMYRTLNGVLLDSKQEALIYYKQIGVNL